MFCSIISLPLKDEDGRLIAPTFFSARLLDSCLFSRTHRHIPSTDLPTFLPVSRAHHFDHFDHLQSAPPTYLPLVSNVCSFLLLYPIHIVQNKDIWRTESSFRELQLCRASAITSPFPPSTPPPPTVLCFDSYHPILSTNSLFLVEIEMFSHTWQ